MDNMSVFVRDGFIVSVGVDILVDGVLVIEKLGYILILGFIDVYVYLDVEFSCLEQVFCFGIMMLMDMQNCNVVKQKQQVKECKDFFDVKSVYLGVIIENGWLVVLFKQVYGFEVCCLQKR